ncbi:NAD-dependent protein deacylase [Athalassotoga saccharophila]|uniref:NAD-dependent protein deacylase n=1 Tax=Athalassotoga saccharophila TaxID=1441386 RepID=UPI00137B55F9|nr:NAD-dependent protein deacylase [Athalassotoga saccharophila]BBJ28425.1 NAD-dependent protein deacetylase [Athalassotoga saccharophila]
MNVGSLIDKITSHHGRVTILTGAGVSTPSGIPDFRSPSGIYSRYDPEELFGLDNFLSNPSYFYKFAVENIFTMKDAKPNVVHYMIEKLESLKLVNGVITQNIDMLHKKAGSLNVAQIHGSIEKGHCIKCLREYSLDEMYSRSIISPDKVARCDCGGVIKPDIIFFGELLPESEVDKAYRMIDDSTLMIAMGTSLAVYPAASFPQITLKKGGELVIVNREPTPLDRWASLIFREDLEKISNEIISLL